MVDLSGGLTTDETVRLCRRYEDLGLTWVEEPADPFDVGALKKISSEVRIPIATGERLYTRAGFRKVLEQHACDILQPDAGNTGGIYEAKKIAAMGEAYNMRVAPHNCASALSTAVALQLSACIPNFMTLEIYPYFPQAKGYVQVLESSPEDRIADGFLALDEAPGYGVSLAHDRLKPFLFAEVK
jgi:galactonate dehydratase